MVVPGSGLVKVQAEAEGIDKILVAAGFEWREPGCSMAPCHDARPPGTAGALCVDVQPQFRGASGLQGSHDSSSRPPWRRRRPSPGVSWTCAPSEGDADGSGLGPVSILLLHCRLLGAGPCPRGTRPGGPEGLAPRSLGRGTSRPARSLRSWRSHGLVACSSRNVGVRIVPLKDDLSIRTALVRRTGRPCS